MFYLSLIIAIILQFIIAELFGRSKHIGRWWMFLLLTSTFIIGGILAWLTSPSAKKNPPKSNSIIKFIGIAIFILGGIGFIATVAQGNISGYILSAPISLIALGAYLWALGLGNIVNNSPKYYFSFLEKDKKYLGKNLSGIFMAENMDVVVYYFLKEDTKQLGPFTYDELKERRINENNLIWKPGIEDFKKASEIEELKNIIVYLPPDKVKGETNIAIQQNLTSQIVVQNIEPAQTEENKEVKELHNEIHPTITNKNENISFKQIEDNDSVKTLVNLFAILYTIFLINNVFYLLIMPQILESLYGDSHRQFVNGFSAFQSLLGLVFIIYYRVKSRNKKIQNLLIYIGLIYAFWLISNISDVFINR